LLIYLQTIFKDNKISNWNQHDIAKSTHIIAFGFLIPLFFVIKQRELKRWYVNGAGFREFCIFSKFSLNPKGNVELAIIALALDYAVITQSVFTALVI